jgi:hypothetical protein
VLEGKYEYATSFPTYDDYETMFQSTDVEDSTYLPLYDAYDEGFSDVIPPTHDEDLVPYLIYDIYNDAGMIVPKLCMEDDNEGDELVDEILYEDDIPHESHHCTVSSSEPFSPLCDSPCHVDEITLHELENQLSVTEDKIVHLLTRIDGAHKFVQDLMWKTELEEIQRTVAGGVTSTQLCITKESLEQVKSDYLELLMDRDLALNFAKEKEREVEDLCYQLILERSSSLTAEILSSLVSMTHEDVSGTHYLREDLFVMIPHKEN